MNDQPETADRHQSAPVDSDSTRDAPPAGADSGHRILSFILLVPYTVIALMSMPFAVVLSMYTGLIIGGEGNPSHPAILPVGLMLLGTPLVTLVGLVGAWISWFRRRGGAAVRWAFLPIVYGGLALTVLGAVERRPPGPPSPTPTPSVAEAPITISMSDAASRRPFQLRNYMYYATWSASVRPDAASCRMDVHLRHLLEDGSTRSIGTIAFASIARGQRPIREAQAGLSHITPGLYVAETVEDAGCDWTLTLTPGRPPFTPRSAR